MIEQSAEIVEVGSLVRKYLFRFVNQAVHLSQHRVLILLISRGVRLLDIRGKTCKTCKEHQKIAVELLFSLWRNYYGKHLVAVRIKVDSVESAKGCRNLILPAARLAAKHSFKINRLVCKLSLVGVFSL